MRSPAKHGPVVDLVSRDNMTEDEGAGLAGETDDRVG